MCDKLNMLLIILTLLLKRYIIKTAKNFAEKGDKRMKKAVCLTMIICLILSAFCSCSENSSSKNSSSDTVSSQTDNQNSVQSQNQTQKPMQNSTQNDKSSPVDSSWFDDAVFLGDSITLKLNYYCDSNPEALGKAQFFCAGSLGYTNALWDINREGNVHPQYKGSSQLSENCAVVTGANKVFVMLGMNDIGGYGIEGALDSAKTLIEKIHTNSPNAVIYVQSTTPMIQAKEMQDLNNANIREFNKLLKAYCDSKNYRYLDIYNLLADENGNLAIEYCGDVDAMGIHFNDISCGLWVDYLKENV